MRIPLLRGMLLHDSDLAPNAPRVIVINEEMARRFWPGENPVGKRLKYGLDPGANMLWKTGVGVVADMRRQRRFHSFSIPLTGNVSVGEPFGFRSTSCAREREANSLAIVSGVLLIRSLV